MNYIDIIVKASLNFKSAAKNVQLKSEPAQVSWALPAILGIQPLFLCYGISK